MSFREAIVDADSMQCCGFRFGVELGMATAANPMVRAGKLRVGGSPLRVNLNGAIEIFSANSRRLFAVVLRESRPLR